MSCKCNTLYHQLDTEPQAFEIADMWEEAKDIRTFVFKGTLHSCPGQFCMLWVPGYDEKPFSLARDSGRGDLVNDLQSRFDDDATFYLQKRGQSRYPRSIWTRIFHREKKESGVGGRWIRHGAASLCRQMPQGRGERCHNDYWCEERGSAHLGKVLRKVRIPYAHCHQ